MKPLSLILLFLSIAAYIAAQERGMQPVTITIEGKTTVLYRHSYALVVGISNYSNGLPPLPGVAIDIPLIRAELEKNGFTVVEVMNPNFDELRKAYNDFISQYGQIKDNRLLFYFAGHGHTERTPFNEGIGYLCPSDAPNPSKFPSEFLAKAFPMDNIETIAKQIKSNHALFIFDACFSGQIFDAVRSVPEGILYKTNEPVRQFITSGKADETVPDNSIFCKQFISAIKGDADGNNDGYVTGTELGEYLLEKVAMYSRGSQHPQYGKIRNSFYDKGDFVFVLNKPPAPQVLIENVIPFEEFKTGYLELTTKVAGILFIDDNEVKPVAANTAITITLAEGEHTILLDGPERIVNQVFIHSGNTAKVIIEKRPLPKLINEPMMIFVEGGTFIMGNNTLVNNEQPKRQVFIGNFFIGETEVTQQQWRDVMGIDPPGLHFKGCNQCPVEGVSWIEVQNFIENLNKKTGKTYRLPTEAEWEYAACGGKRGKGTPFSGSVKIEKVAWFNANSQAKTHLVKKKRPNELGLYDMSGNVWEWCSDWYSDDFENDLNIITDNPVGPATGDFRLTKGGSWGSLPQNCQVGDRSYDDPENRDKYLGFRLVLVP